jgi:hypothetical protein
MGGSPVGAKISTFSYIIAMKHWVSAIFAALFVFSAATGSHGEILSASPTSGIKSGQIISVSGKNFDETVGIYVEMCQIVPAGTLPEVCGGGVNMSGTNAASFWISSNPPSYGKNLAIAFKPGGIFKVGLKVQPLIGKVDCRKVRCAIYVRADHTRTQDRTHDIKIPISFAK